MTDAATDSAGMSEGTHGLPGPKVGRLLDIVARSL